MNAQARARQFQPTVVAVVLFACLEGVAQAPPAPSDPPTNATPSKVDRSRNHVGSNHTVAPSPMSAPPRQRPRTLADAREQRNQSAGQATKEAGTANGSEGLETDPVAMSVETYDAAFVEVVQQRWNDLLEQTHVVSRSGKVVLDFRLNHDGSVTDMKEAVCEAGPLLGALCQAAVLDPAPYASWPAEMRHEIGASHRRVTVTFCSFEGAFGPTRFEARPPHAHLVCELWRYPRTVAPSVSRTPDWGRDNWVYIPLMGPWTLGCGYNPFFQPSLPLDQKCWEKDQSRSLGRDLHRWRDSLPRCQSWHGVPK